MVAVLTAVGCGKKDDDKEKGDSGAAKLTMANTTGAELVQTPNEFTPTSYGLKLVSVRLKGKTKDGQDFGPIIWVSPACPSEVSATEVDETLYDYVHMHGCPADAVKDYFEFARSTDAVNADLNSQALPVPPGTYTHVSLSWCEGDLQNDFMTFKTDDMDTAFVGTNGNGCIGATSEEANPPITIEEGQSVTVNLDYDLTGIVIDMAYIPGSDEPVSCWESADKSFKRCAKLPAFKPSIK